MNSYAARFGDEHTNRLHFKQQQNQDGVFL